MMMMMLFEGFILIFVTHHTRMASQIYDHKSTREQFFLAKNEEKNQQLLFGW
jgi:hypothetical protein